LPRTKNLTRPEESDDMMHAGFAAAALLGTVTLAFLPNSYEADVVKQPLLVCGVVILLGLLLTAALLHRRLMVVRTSADVVLLLFLLLTVVQALHAPDSRNARDAAFLWGAFGVMFFAGTHAFGAGRAREVFARSVMVVVAAVECVAVAGVLIPGLPVEVFVAGAGSRTGSTLGSASILAAFLAGMLPLLLSEAKRFSGRAKVIPCMLIAGAFALILLSGSRGGLLAAVVASGGYLLLTAGSKKSAIVLTGGLICALALVMAAVPSLHQRFFGFFSGTGTASVERRIVIWDAAWNAVRDAPVTGHGTGSFESIVPQFRTPEYWMNGSEDIVRHAHNEPLEIWAELGIAGLILWLLIVLRTLRRGIALASSPPGKGRDLVAALTAGFAALLVENLAGVSLRNPVVGGYAWLFAGLIWGSTPGEGNAAVRIISVKTARLPALLPALVAVAWAIVTITQLVPLFQSESLYINARVLESRGDQKAGDVFVAAYEICPWNPQAAMSAAGVYFRLGEPAKSLGAIDAAQKRFPLYPRSNLLRGMVMASLGKYRDADTCIRKELAIRSGPEGLHVQSILARAMGDSAVERKALRQLVRASISTGRDFFVMESCARLLDLPGPDSAEVTALVLKAQQQFGTPHP
jgi:putative inorganic carbon (HCO3(-)) transporter